MPANVGRTQFVYWGDDSPQELVAGVREKGITLNGELIDVTNDDSSGWRELLNVAGVRSVDIPVSGVLKTSRLTDDWFAGNRIQNLTFEFSDGRTLTGKFGLAEYEETGEHEGEITFEVTFQSTGVVIYTPAA
ncbi:phage major tail protein, TP901-1 family [Filomicrobium insigne]|uniref:Phage major tail protein, TP901-1 family n=1 Tax=Filomicrobium insigne TaxID=418854 RepID=A0A1H0SFZ5_9HYPH|nr:phage tail tube protein [Filomicrobium insigne]SDP40644.1 phage major tail protein, TP901-1 family [Filomicrobium insigne]